MGNGLMNLEPALEELGLSKTEARVYLCLLGQSPLAAATIADRTGTSRSSLYLVLRSLVDKGFIAAGAGYSSRYHPVPPQHALGGLLERDRAQLDRRERHAEDALPALSEIFERSGAGTEVGEIVEILRTPKLIGERFDRLQSAAKNTIDIVVRGPIQVGGVNQAEQEALRRGVRARAIYDSAALDDPSVAGNLSAWLAEGEQARVYDGELPMKFALFDGHTVLMPLVAPGVTGVVAIIVRNRELAAALGFLFETIWERSEPLESRPAPERGRHGHRPPPSC
ncbi:TrmB family transcriptional regulator [Actinopolymorpha alba]|uniref:TrmB family transcriptional regulator n=1 Tax=Actinopolymorpha alba TaxID=533267 RepID=UPI00036AA3C0|nr:helix-turn-helix domain-containing protein [Actinopolymorpha alba]